MSDSSEMVLLEWVEGSEKADDAEQVEVPRSNKWQVVDEWLCFLVVGQSFFYEGEIDGDCWICLVRCGIQFFGVRAGGFIAGGCGGNRCALDAADG